MADEIEPTSGKKHRIIHWNPDANKEQARRKWTLPRILLTGLIAFALLIAVGRGVVSVLKNVKPEIFEPATEAAVDTDPTSRFVSQTSAQYELQEANKGLEMLKKLPINEHPRHVETFVLITKSLEDGRELIADRHYARAVAHLKTLNQEIDLFAKSIRAKQEAQQLYSTLNIRIRDLRANPQIPAAAIDGATSAASLSSQLLQDGAFLDAKLRLEKGLQILADAEKELSNRIQEGLVAGQQALNRGDRSAAVAAFNKALESSPGNDVAMQGLKRAETIDRLHALLTEAADAEKAGDYAKAEAAFKQAFALDKFSATAQEGQSRTARLGVESRFRNALEAAETAFKNREWEKAIASAQTAESVTPGKPEIAKLIRDARENLRTDTIQAALKRAGDAEERRDWSAAKETYQSIARMNPRPDEKAMADDGVTRTSQVIRALIEFRFRLDEADKLASQALFERAIDQFNLAAEAKPSYLAWDERAQRLRKLLDEQSEPVDVTFQGDSKTWVSVEGLRNLQTIDRVTIKLPPGDYAVIGRRAGYRDVLIQLQVRNGQPLPVVTVICTVRADRAN